jgi:hypothetical protein
MRRGDGSGRLARLTLWGAGAIVVLLGVAQIVLPKLAASRISSRVQKYGTVQSVHVSAWPALKLLWGDADSATVRASDLRLSPGESAKLLSEASGVHDLDLTATSASEGPLSVSDVRLRKRGDALHAQALASTAGVQAALPAGFGVQLLSSREGHVEVRASGGLFGVGASVDAVAEASEGKLVVHPRGLLLEGLQLTLFSDPRVYVEGVGAQASGAGGGYVLSIDAQLR